MGVGVWNSFPNHLDLIVSGVFVHIGGVWSLDRGRGLCVRIVKDNLHRIAHSAKTGKLGSLAIRAL